MGSLGGYGFEGFWSCLYSECVRKKEDTSHDEMDSKQLIGKLPLTDTHLTHVTTNNAAKPYLVK